MSEIQPDRTDAILGGQTPPPVNAAVLGGVAGIEQQFINQWGLNKESIDRFSFETVFVNKYAEIIDRQQKEAFCHTLDIRGVPLELIYIPAGSFLMGGFDKTEPENRSEQPIHLVTIQSFFIGKYPVTQQQFSALMGMNPSESIGDDRHPVQRVFWGRAMEFCRILSKLTNKNFTLPSEAQWEYACRAGTDNDFCFGQEINSDLVNTHNLLGLDEYAKNQYPGKTTPVGIYPPNSWGLYDMHGNVGEWCLDTMHNNYMNAPSDGSAWINFHDDNRHGSHYYHPVRGGSWNSSWNRCMSYKRLFTNDVHLLSNIGFRICMVLKSNDPYTTDGIPF